MNRKTLLYIAITLLCSFRLGAQYYNTGQDPASLKWKQLSSDHFSFLFPSAYEDEARKTAYIFEEAYKLTGGRYGEAPISRFPVIIHNYSTESNGYLAWAPKRIELFPYPGQNSIPLPHYDQLALHELIHVSQVQAFRKGFSKPLEYLFGEQYTGALSIFAPFWFLEGEAVVSESIFSTSGRGRQPDFEKELKALILDPQKLFSYDKLINGSYKNYTPNHYQFGYQMSAFARTNYGNDVFSAALETIGRKPFTLNPFNHSLKRSSGQTKKKLYDSTIDYLRLNWSREDSLLVKSDFTYIDKRINGEFINYHSPKVIGLDSIIAIKTSLEDPAEFVLITDNGESETRLKVPGYVWPYRISVAGSIITWAEQEADPRWDNRAYSVIKTYNIRTGISNRITKKTRLFSPAISPDSKLIVASASSENNKNSLVLIDRAMGIIIDTIEAPENVLPINPCWSEDGKMIGFIFLGMQGEGIMVYNTESYGFTTAVDEGNSDLQSLAIRNDTLFYTSSYSGINNIYALDPDNNTRQLTSSRFGVSDIDIDGGSLIFADYSSRGNRLARYPISQSYGYIYSLIDKPLLQIDRLNSSGKLSYSADYVTDSFKVEPYRKWKHLFNFHSWMPFYADVNNLSFDDIAISPGLTLLSQNHLSTLTSSIAYEYLNGEHLLHTNLIWEGQYPAVDLNLSYGGMPLIAQDSDSIYYPSSVNQGMAASATFYLPLRFTKGKYYQTFYPSLRLKYQNDYIYQSDIGSFDYGQILATGRLYFSNLHKMAYRDIWPRWGQVVDVFGTFSPGDRSIYGPINTIRTTIYTPGIFKNHGIKLRYQAERQDITGYIQYNRISLPRGYHSIVSSNLQSISVDYAMPLAYPDLNLGSLLYLKRIRSGIFYDYSLGEDNYHLAEHQFEEQQEKFHSYGVELLADFYLLRLPFGFSSGIQYAWLPEEKDTYIKFLFNIDVFGFVLGRKSPNKYY